MAKGLGMNTITSLLRRMVLVRQALIVGCLGAVLTGCPG